MCVCLYIYIHTYTCIFICVHVCIYTGKYNKCPCAPFCSKWSLEPHLKF